MTMIGGSGIRGRGSILRVCDCDEELRANTKHELCDILAYSYMKEETDCSLVMNIFTTVKVITLY